MAAPKQKLGYSQNSPTQRVVLFSDLEPDARHKHPINGQDYTGRALLEHMFKEVSYFSPHEVNLLGDNSHYENLSPKKLALRRVAGGSIFVLLQIAGLHEKYDVGQAGDAILTAPEKFESRTVFWARKLRETKEELSDNAFEKAKQIGNLVVQYTPNSKVIAIAGNHDPKGNVDRLVGYLTDRGVDAVHHKHFEALESGGFVSVSKEGAKAGLEDIFGEHEYLGEEYLERSPKRLVEYIRWVLEQAESARRNNGAPIIIRAHEPPLGIHDNGFGNKLLAEISGSTPAVVYSGHVHERPGVAQLENGSIVIQTASAGAGPGGTGIFTEVEYTPGVGVSSIRMNGVVPAKDGFVTVPFEHYTMGENGRLTPQYIQGRKVEAQENKAPPINTSGPPITDAVPINPKEPIKLEETITDKSPEEEKSLKKQGREQPALAL